ncbi:hypothetical protein QQF64_036445 [Cirrhinus molitorella]|uniref:DUF5641 domain-containing protein n=1 Tax=Cirrhinus molitorella TaxID=172907 RepID=A0ABR3NJ91_9TELE
MSPEDGIKLTLTKTKEKETLWGATLIDQVDPTRPRTKMKIWGVMFSCMASRAVHADIVEDLLTEGFLKAYQCFTALRGHPRKLWSDQGTNFVGARPVLQELYEFLTLEFQTLLYLAANLTNERPISARAQVQDEAVEIITPNSLLLGRAGTNGDSRGFEYPSYPFLHLRAIQTEVDKFWKQWSQLAGPNLYIRQKWHTPSRNVVAGDMVCCPVSDGQSKRNRGEENYPSTILYREVRRLMVLLPVEEQ